MLFDEAEKAMYDRLFKTFEGYMREWCLKLRWTFTKRFIPRDTDGLLSKIIS